MPTSSQIRAGWMALSVLLAASWPARTPATEAREILEAARVHGGLAVVIGCGDLGLPVQLASRPGMLVHALERDATKAARARELLYEKGLCGRVTVSPWQSDRLPLVDRSVKLLLVADPEVEISAEEVRRVVCPLGVVADLRDGRLHVARVGWPRQLDQWTHWLYDASNNAVSSDELAGRPRGLRWTSGPKFARSHEHLASLGAMVTAGGRLFYVIDTGPTSSVYLPPEWRLVARDAFSGVLLWQRPIAGWASHLRGFRSGPPELPRRLVADGKRVYLAGALGDPVVVLAAETGRQVAVLEETHGARELLLAEGKLYVLADDMTAEQHERRKEWIANVWPTLDIWYRFPRVAAPIYGRQRVLAFDAGSARLLWQQQFGAPGEVMPATMAVADDRLCVQTVEAVVCFHARSGKRLWTAPHPVARSRYSWSAPTLVIHGGVVLVADRRAEDNAGRSVPAEGSQWIFSSGGCERDVPPGRLVALDLADGHKLWEAPCYENYNTQIDVFVIDGVVWTSNLRHGDDPGFTIAAIATRPPGTGCWSVAAGSCWSSRAKAWWATIPGCAALANTE